MKTKVYILPGFGDQASSNMYKNVVNYFSTNASCELIPLHWKYNSVGNYLGEILSYVTIRSDEKIILFGFSFGALLALMVSSIIHPDKLFLCSLSPFFREDITKNKQAIVNTLGKKRSEFLQHISFKRIAEGVSCPVDLFVGEQESPTVIKRAGEVHLRLRRSTLFIVRQADHNLLNESYDNMLRKRIR